MSLGDLSFAASQESWKFSSDLITKGGMGEYVVKKIFATTEM